MNSHWMTNGRDPDDDALLRAMFAEGDRPPYGDETFVKGVMARVEKQASSAQAWRAAAAPALIAFGAAAFYPLLGPVGAVIGQAAAPLLQNAPAISAGGLSLLMAAAAAGGAWLYAERT